MTELDLLEQVVKELEKIEQEEIADAEEFRDRYELLIDCAVDEINDEILKRKLNDVTRTGRLILIKDGTHAVYRGGIISSYKFIGGEEFKLSRVEKGLMKNKGSLVNFIFEPLQPSQYHYLALAYEKALEYMDASFGKAIAHNLLDAMNSIHQDVVSLQHEYADRHRERQLRISGESTQAYSEANSW